VCQDIVDNSHELVYRNAIFYGLSDFIHSFLDEFFCGSFIFLMEKTQRLLACINDSPDIFKTVHFIDLKGFIQDGYLTVLINPSYEMHQAGCYWKFLLGIKGKVLLARPEDRIKKK